MWGIIGQISELKQQVEASFDEAVKYDPENRPTENPADYSGQVTWGDDVVEQQSRKQQGLDSPLKSTTGGMLHSPPGKSQTCSPTPPGSGSSARSAQSRCQTMTSIAEPVAAQPMLAQHSEVSDEFFDKFFDEEENALPAQASEIAAPAVPAAPGAATSTSPQADSELVASKQCKEIDFDFDWDAETANADPQTEVVEAIAMARCTSEAAPPSRHPAEAQENSVAWELDMDPLEAGEAMDESGAAVKLEHAVQQRSLPPQGSSEVWQVDLHEPDPLAGCTSEVVTPSPHSKEVQETNIAWELEMELPEAGEATDESSAAVKPEPYVEQSSLLIEESIAPSQLGLQDPSLAAEVTLLASCTSEAVPPPPHRVEAQETCVAWELDTELPEAGEPMGESSAAMTPEPDVQHISLLTEESSEAWQLDLQEPDVVAQVSPLASCTSEAVTPSPHPAKAQENSVAWELEMKLPEAGEAIDESSAAGKSERDVQGSSVEESNEAWKLDLQEPHAAGEMPPMANCDSEPTPPSRLPAEAQEISAAWELDMELPKSGEPAHESSAAMTPEPDVQQSSFLTQDSSEAWKLDLQDPDVAAQVHPLASCTSEAVTPSPHFAEVQNGSVAWGLDMELPESGDLTNEISAAVKLEPDVQQNAVLADESSEAWDLDLELPKLQHVDNDSIAEENASGMQQSSVPVEESTAALALKSESSELAVHMDNHAQEKLDAQLLQISAATEDGSASQELELDYSRQSPLAVSEEEIVKKRRLRALQLLEESSTIWGFEVQLPESAGLVDERYVAHNLMSHDVSHSTSLKAVSEVEAVEAREALMRAEALASEAESRAKVMEARVETMTAELQEAQHGHMLAEARLVEAEAQAKAADSQAKVLAAEVQEARKAQTLAEALTREVQARAAEAQSHAGILASRLQAQVTEAKEAHATAEARTTDSETRATQTREKVEEAESQVQSLTLEVQKAKDAQLKAAALAAEAQAKADEAETRADAVTAKLQAQVEKIQRDHALGESRTVAQITEAQAQVQEARDAQSHAETLLAEAQAQAAESQAQVKLMMAEMQSKAADMQDGQAKLESVVTEVNSRLQQAEGRAQELEVRAMAAEAKSGQLAEDVRARAAEVHDCRADLELARGAAEAAQLQAKEAGARMAELQASAAAARALHEEQLQEAAESKDEQHRRLKSMTEAAELELKQQCLSYTQQISDLETKLHDQEKLLTKQQSKASKELEAVKSTVDSTQRELRESMESSQRDLRESEEARLREAAENSKQYLAQGAKYEARIRAILAELAEGKLAREAAEQARESVEEELHRERAQRLQQPGESSNGSATGVGLEKKFEMALQAIGKLQEELEACKDQRDAYRAQCKDLMEVIGSSQRS